MKIRGDNPDIQTGGTVGSEAVSLPVSSSRAGGAAAGADDSLELSADAQLLRAALDAATATPTIRSEVVERTRALLQQHRLGADAAALADAMIRALMHEDD